MKPLLLKLLYYLTGWLTEPVPIDKPIQPVGFTTEPASVGVDSERVLVDSILKSDKVSHANVCNLAKTFFNTDITSNYFCFKGGGPYGVILEISNVGMATDEHDRLADIFLHLSDVTMGTSLTLTVSVKDLNELLVPFFPKQVVFS